MSDWKNNAPNQYHLSLNDGLLAVCDSREQGFSILFLPYFPNSGFFYGINEYRNRYTREMNLRELLSFDSEEEDALPILCYRPLIEFKDGLPERVRKRALELFERFAIESGVSEQYRNLK